MDILLIDDHAPTREEMTLLIEGQEDMHVIGQADSGREGVRQADQLRPDLVVVDVVMPGMNGIEASRAIRSDRSAAAILALSNHTGRNLVKAMLDIGVKGYVRKDHAYEELIPAIRAVHRGERYLGTGVDD